MAGQNQGQPASSGDGLVSAETAVSANPIDEKINRRLKHFHITLILFACAPLYFFLSIIGLIPALFLLLYLLITFVEGIREFFRAKQEKLKSIQTLVLPGFLVPLFIAAAMILAFLSINIGTTRVFMRHGWVIESIGRSFREYAQNHENRWPEAEQWCNQLIEDRDNNKSYLETEPESKLCQYAMNIYAQPLGSQMPKDMVLLFESRRGWNQSGGGELLPEDVEGNGRIAVLFGDLNVKHVRFRDIPYLRWKLEGNPVKPAVSKTHLYFILISVFLTVCLPTVVKNGSYCREYWMQIVLLAFIAMGCGALLGQLSLMLYPYEDKETALGWISGLASGGLMAVAYLPVLARLAGRIADPRLIIPHAVVLGSVAGVLCSSFTHAVLMIYFEERSPWALLGGTGYGIYAGAMLGLAAGAMVKAQLYRKAVPLSEGISV
jgi:hypothetical protein